MRPYFCRVWITSSRRSFRNRHRCRELIALGERKSRRQHGLGWIDFGDLSKRPPALAAEPRPWQGSQFVAGVLHDVVHGRNRRRNSCRHEESSDLENGRIYSRHAVGIAFAAPNRSPAKCSWAVHGADSFLGIVVLSLEREYYALDEAPDSARACGCARNSRAIRGV